MKITVKLFASLRKDNPKEQDIEISENSCLNDVLKQIKISPQDVSIIMINGRRMMVDQTLQTGDVVSLFPPVGGG